MTKPASVTVFWFAAARRHLNESETGFTLPSPTPHFAPGGGWDTQQTEAARAQVRQWREQHKLPFPDASAERESTIPRIAELPASGLTLIA